MTTKPECRIICNKGNRSSNDLLYEVSKILRKPEHRESYEAFVRKTNIHDSCENLLRESLKYVRFCFVYMDLEEEME